MPNAAGWMFPRQAAKDEIPAKTAKKLQKMAALEAER